MKNKEEGDKNSSYGISNTSFIIIIYDDGAVSLTHVLHWLMTSNSAKLE